MNKIDSGLEYRKQFNTEDELQNVLRDRMIRCIKEKKITQKSICKATGINEGALSNWKNKKPIGTTQMLNRVENYYLDLISIGALNIFLGELGY
jgi:transcriptional regulator with XRE-family HTH domain